MNPTHLLIPIKDIEDSQKAFFGNKRCSDLMKVIANAKQISLTEDDIEAKSAVVYPAAISIYSSDSYKKQGYIQALKDLLK